MFSSRVPVDPQTMLDSPSLATARLVVRSLDDRVYCVPQQALTHGADCRSPAARRGGRLADSALVTDLLTKESLLLPESCLSPFAVPDRHVGDLIRSFGATGIRTPYKAEPVCSDPAEVPLHGNLTDPEWAVVGLGGACNNRCVFCYTDWVRAVPNLQTGQVRDALDRIAEIGTVTTLVFSGGEPAIRSDLVSLFSYAKRTGFPQMELQTNGRELGKTDLVERLMEHGLRAVLLSLHGPSEMIHDGITRNPGSFTEALAGLRTLAMPDIALTVNIVMCQANYTYLADTVTLLSATLSRRGRVRFSYPIVEGAAFDNVDGVIVPFSRLGPHMLGAMALAEEEGLEVEVANIPLCVPNHGHRKTVYDTHLLSRFVEASPFYMFNIPRGEVSVKLERCSQCAKVDLCRGIQVEYLRAHPGSANEFQPFD